MSDNTNSKELSRREFLSLFAASIVSMGLSQNQVLDYLTDKTPLSKPVIYLDVDSMAFFNAAAPKAKPVKTSELRKKEPIDMHWPIMQRVSMYLPPESVYYFSTNPKDDVKTTTVIGECIVFGAYTTYPDGRIKSSGVYHAKTLPPDQKFKKRMNFFIDTLRPYPNQTFFIKGSGHYGYGSQELLVEDLESVLKKKNLRIEDYFMDVGELVGKVNTFYPATGAWIDEVFLAKRK
jgi:hypothetical protein